MKEKEVKDTPEKDVEDVEQALPQEGLILRWYITAQHLNIGILIFKIAYYNFKKLY